MDITLNDKELLTIRDSLSMRKQTLIKMGTASEIIDALLERIEALVDLSLKKTK